MWKLFFRLSILALAIVCSVASWSLETVRHDSGVMEQNDGVPSHLRRSINVSVKADEVCVFDRLKIDWEAGPFTDLDAVGIAFMSMGSKVGRVLSLQSMLKIDHIDPLLISIDGLIRCDVNEEHCVPKVQSISALPDQNRIVVLFEVATTQPLLQDVFSLQEALIVRPEIRFPGAFAEWVAPDRLEIQVDSIDMQALLTTHSKGGLIEAVPRSSKSYVKKGSSVIRPAEPGSYEVIVVDRANGMQQLPASEANAHIVKVEACEDAEVITTRHVEGLQIQAGGIPSNSAAPQSSPLSPGPKQTLVVQGPAAVTGRQPMTFADGTVDPKGGGTWSVSSWIRLLEPATGNFRAVLHKGSPDGQTRTPSIWLMPSDNRLSVRVSTEKNPDIGAETISAIPTNQWTFLTIVFNNHTKPMVTPTDSDIVASLDHAGVDENAAADGMLVTHPSTVESRTKSSDAADAVAKDTTQLSAASGNTTPSSEGPQYTVEVYINGVLDVKLEFSHLVLGNNHTANFFKDVSFSGPKSLLSEFALWDGALTAKEVESMYLSSAGRVQRTSVDTALDVLATAESTLAFAAASTPVPSLSSTDTASITAADSTSNEDDTIKSSTNTAAKEPIYADPRQIKEDAMVPILLQRAKTGLEACEGFTTRLDIYAEAAERGSAEALYKWAMLVKQGSEVSNTACGVSSSSTSEGEGGQGAAALSGTASALWGSKPTDKSVAFEHERAVQALLVAADMGHSAALVPLSFALLNGLGAEPMLRGNTSVSSAWNIPLHPSYIAEEGPRGCYRPVQLQRAISDYLLSGELGCGDRNGADSLAGNPAALANSVLRVRHQNASAAGIGSTESISGNQEGEEGLRELRKKGKRCPDPTSLAVGLLHVAALHEIPEAHQALAYRYREGFGVSADVETAVFYHRLPSRVTAEEFHLIGAQSVVETDRIDDLTAPELSKGHQGNDDELIQHQKIRAKEGHLPSILAMADLYYYGARGLPRDHVRALRYFEQAAQLGDETGLCGSAGMFLKGEGTDTNVTRAVELYENASSTGSIRALNGLGYLYFFGQSVPQNHTKAFHYFLTAAMYETDADSLFNAAHCLENGLGTERDIARAVQFYTIAANKLGNFNSINVLANMYYEGRGVPRSVKTALMYFKSATSIGAWAGWLRRGFDQYLSGQYGRSVGAYLHTGELGYEVSQSNAAYILRTKLKVPTGSYTNTFAVLSPPSITAAADHTCDASLGPQGHCESDVDSALHNSTNISAQLAAESWGSAAEWRERLLARLYQLSAYHGNQESNLHLGTCYFKGACGVAQDHKRALWYYSKASAQGHALSSAYLGVMYHFGLGAPANLHRAERYYALAVEKEKDRTVVAMVESLKYALSMKDFYFMMPVNLGLDYVVRTLWKA